MPNEIKLEPREIPFRIRQSVLEDAKCLHRFQRHHVQGVPSPSSEPSQRGTDVHELHRQYVNHLVATRQETDFDFADELAKGQFAREAADLFTGWVRQRVFDPDRVYGTEVNILLDWDFNPVPEGTPVSESPFSITMDRLEIEHKKADIIDLKSHFGIFQPTTIQAIFYPWVLHKTMPDLEEITFTLDFVRFPGLKTPQRTFSATDLEKHQVHIINEVKRLFQALDEDEWPAMVNDKCSWCIVDCPFVEAGMSRESIGKIANSEEAVELAQELHSLQKQADRLKGILRSYVLQFGHLPLPNHLELGFRPAPRMDYSVKQIVALNEEHGFDRNRALKADPIALRRIARQYPNYMHKLSETAKNVGTTKFQFQSVVAGDPMNQEDGEDDD